ncbi:Aldehyde reductase YahK [compost metagenome]
MIGGIAETQEMLDFCGKHNIISDIELIKMQDINHAYDRLLKSDVKYRFVIDMASLKN